MQERNKRSGHASPSSLLSLAGLDKFVLLRLTQSKKATKSCHSHSVTIPPASSLPRTHIHQCIFQFSTPSYRRILSVRSRLENKIQNTFGSCIDVIRRRHGSISLQKGLWCPNSMGPYRPDKDTQLRRKRGNKEINALPGQTARRLRNIQAIGSSSSSSSSPRRCSCTGRSPCPIATDAKIAVAMTCKLSRSYPKCVIGTSCKRAANVLAFGGPLRMMVMTMMLMWLLNSLLIRFLFGRAGVNHDTESGNSNRILFARFLLGINPIWNK